MSTMSELNKMTKEQLAKVLGNNFIAVKKASKEVAERIMYASKKYKEDNKSVTKKDLLDLVKDTMSALGNKFVLATDSMDISAPVLAENSVKPSGKKLSKKKDSGDTEKEVEKEEEATAKKPAKKTPKKKESAVKPLNEEDEDKPVYVLADQFNEEIEVDGNKYSIAHDIKTMKDLIKAFENEETLVFAYYWTARHLRQYNYFEGFVQSPKEFPMDLDLASVMYVSDEGVIAYAISMYTEANYLILPKDLEEVDGLRFSSGGIEFQIYRLIEE